MIPRKIELFYEKRKALFFFLLHLSALLFYLIIILAGEFIFGELRLEFIQDLGNWLRRTGVFVKILIVFILSYGPALYILCSLRLSWLAIIVNFIIMLITAPFYWFLILIVGCSFGATCL